MNTRGATWTPQNLLNVSYGEMKGNLVLYVYTDVKREKRKKTEKLRPTRQIAFSVNESNIRQSITVKITVTV